MRGSQSTGSSHVRAFVAAALCLCVLISFVSHAWASYGASPVGSPTMPPSSYEGGLVTNPNPIDSSGNAVINGNVGGGKQFRGPIPYNASTSFQSQLGSTGLDSFMRYSAIPQEPGGYTSGYETFYSPTGTVSKIRPGQSGVFAPTSPRVAGGIGQWRAEPPPDVVDLGEIRQSRVPASETGLTSDAAPDAWRQAGSWSLGRTPEQMKPIVPDEMGRQFADDRAPQQNDQPLTSEEYRQQMEQFRQQIEKVKADASRLEQSLRVDDALPKDMSKQMTGDPSQTASLRTAIENLMRPRTASQPPTAERRGDLDLLTRPASPIPDTASFEKQMQMPDASGIAGIVTPASPTPAAGVKSSVPPESRSSSRGLQGSSGELGADAATRTNRIADLFLPKGQAGTGQTQPDNSGNLPALRRIQEPAGTREKLPDLSLYTPANPAGGAASNPDRVASLMEHLDSTTAGETGALAGTDANEPVTGQPKPSAPAIGDQAQSKYDTLPKASRERFDRYLKAAELYLQQGQCQRAVESFSLASAYNPNDRRVQLGRSHALFAAGEYVSSAVFLAKAIELDPNQTLAKLDLVSATGGPELFLRRIMDLEQSAKTNSTPDIQLLLAYIYYEMDRPEEAKAAVEAAEKGLPRLPAVALLKAAIIK